jgi:hypothetical protein
MSTVIASTGSAAQNSDDMPRQEIPDAAPQRVPEGSEDNPAGLATALGSVEPPPGEVETVTIPVSEGRADISAGLTAAQSSTNPPPQTVQQIVKIKQEYKARADSERVPRRIVYRLEDAPEAVDDEAAAEGDTTLQPSGSVTAVPPMTAADVAPSDDDPTAPMQAETQSSCDSDATDASVTSRKRASQSGSTNSRSKRLKTTSKDAVAGHSSSLDEEPTEADNPTDNPADTTPGVTTVTEDPDVDIMDELLVMDLNISDIVSACSPDRTGKYPNHII